MSLFSRQLVWLVLVAFLAVQVAAAAESVRIPASPKGPSASLVLEGKSAYLLPHLQLPNGTPIKQVAGKMRTLDAEYFLLDPDAKPDKAGYWKMIRQENEAYGQAGEKNRPAATSRLGPASVKALAEAQKRISEMENKLMQLTNQKLVLQQQLDAASRQIARLQQQLDAASKQEVQKSDGRNTGSGNSVSPILVSGLVLIVVVFTLFCWLFRKLQQNSQVRQEGESPSAGSVQSPLNLSGTEPQPPSPVQRKRVLRTRVRKAGE